MRVVLTTVVGVLALTLGVHGNAQEAARQPSGQMVTIDVVIAEFASPGRADAVVQLESADDAAAKIRERQQQGAVAVLTRASLTSLDSHRATVQIGERVAVPSGRMVRGGGRGDAGGFPLQTNYTEQNVGTMISATARVQADGSVVVEFQAEKSRLAPLLVREQVDGDTGGTDVPPSRLSTLTVQSTVRIAPGETVIVSGLGVSAEQESGQAVVLLSARVSDKPDGAAQAAADTRSLHIFHLQHANAKEIAATLADLLPDQDKGLHVGVDERTNSLLLSATPDLVQVVQALLAKLDEGE